MNSPPERTRLGDYRPARGLAMLAEQVRHDLERLRFPAENWVLPRDGPDAGPLLDVLIVGAGMCGQAAAFELMRQGVRNLRVIDAAGAGTEGPWCTYARMNILRSPKHLTGPDLGVPSLTYRAWHEARYGLAHWDKLHKIDRLDWHAYLLWVREQTGIVVEHQTHLTKIATLEDRVAVELQRRLPGQSFGAAIERLQVRKLVLATGRDGSGAWRWPRFASFDPRSRALHGRVFHSADVIDFARWKDCSVAVLGAGASAFDNAAAALEAGARKVEMFVRRSQLPQVNKSKWAAFAGFMHGFAQLSDEQRWRFYTYIFDEQVPPPWESVQRCDRHPNFSVHFGAGWEDLVSSPETVHVLLRDSRRNFDAVVLATGFHVDLAERAEFDAIRGDVQLWADRVSEDAASEHVEAARFPYLGDGFELLPRHAESPESISRIHLFNYGCTMSHGELAGDIPGVAEGAQRLARAVSRDLFVENVEEHYEHLRALEEPELEPTRFFVPAQDPAAATDET